MGPEPRSYTCTTPSGKAFLCNRYQIQPIGLPDKQQSTQPDEQQSTTLKSAMKTSSAPARKKVSWSDKVNIMVDSVTAYFTATQHAEIFAITDDAEPVPVTLAVPAVPDDELVPAASKAEPEVPASAEEPDSHLPMQTSPVASAEATQSPGWPDSPHFVFSITSSRCKPGSS